MAPATNLLTFSLSPMEKMLSSSDSEFVQYDTSSAYSSPHYFFDNLYANGWTNPILNYSAQVEQNQGKENQSHNMSDHLTSLMNSQNQNQTLVPKLEDLFENQDSSSLTRIYHHAYRQDLKANAGFQAFSTNSGSEVDDSASIAKQQATPGEFGSAHSVESSKNELALISSCSKGTSSLGTQSSDKAVVAADSDGSKKIGGSFGQRTSIFRGITRHRWTGRYEAHLWDNSCRREGQARKGRQVYLGGYDKEEKAARAYDLAALKYWGPTAITNYPVSNYTKELEEMKHAGKQEFIASLRRKSSGFSRGASIYRGVTRHHQQGRWQARIGRVAGNKDLYLGTFATQEEAAKAYDIAAIKFRGENAVTNFEMSRYDVEAILNNSLPVGGVAKRLKLSLESEKKAPMSDSQQPQCRRNVSSSINFSTIQPIAYYHHNHFQHLQPTNAGSGTEESAVTTSNAITLPPEAEFYIWPHQSY